MLISEARAIKRVFIASVNQDGRTDTDEKYLEIRAKIAGLQLDGGLHRWIAEFEKPELPNLGWRRVVDTCVRELTTYDLMVVILYRRLGTPIEVDELGPSPVTYLEIELFHASLKRLPVIFFQAEDFEPNERLASMLELLKRITHPCQWRKSTERAIEAEVIDTIRFIDRTGELPATLSGFGDALSDDRSFLKIDEETASTRLSFLDGFASGSPGPISLARVDRLLVDANEMTGKGESDYADRLSRLWMALRDLAQASADDLGIEVATRWVRLCELWTSSAAWLHLHGPLELGVLATLHTRVSLRNAGFIDEASFPYTSFASEAYSIAKFSTRRDWKVRRFRAAQVLATKQITLDVVDSSGAYGVRASATMQLATMGRPWLALPARVDYVQMLRTRERIGSSASEVGEATVELAYADFMLGRHLPWVRRNSLALMRDGLSMMEVDAPENRAGFVSRAKRKLFESLERAGLHEEAAAQRTSHEQFVRLHGLPGD